MSASSAAALLLALSLHLNAADVSHAYDPCLGITGGADIRNITQVPYQISLHVDGPQTCSAVIYNQTWAVTTANCVYDLADSLTKTTVRVGTTLSNWEGRVHNVTKIVVHPSFDLTTMDHDIALIQVTPPFNFSDIVQPVQLPDNGEILTSGTPVSVTGWGAVQEGCPNLGRLRGITVTVLSRSTCNQAYAMYGGITDNMMCAGSTDGVHDTCSGDGGSPLVAYGKLFGLASWGLGCGRVGYPGIYTRVTVFKKWIQG